MTVLIPVLPRCCLGVILTLKSGTSEHISEVTVANDEKIRCKNGRRSEWNPENHRRDSRSRQMKSEICL